MIIKVHKMKILVISSSPHKNRGQTFRLAKEVLRGCCDNNSVESQIIHLCDLKIGFCRHCEACHKNFFSCPIKDDVHIILKEILKADAIILASPNYINHITGSMKVLFDRLSHLIHCKGLLGKYVAGVVSSGSGHDKKVLDYIKFYSHTCGAQYSGGISSCVPVSRGKAKEAFRLGKKLICDVKYKRIHPAQIKIIEKGKEYFKRIILLRRDDWVEEYDYWKKKGWL